MPQIISCPDCGRKLRVPDHLLGKKVKCPGCGVHFVGQADEAPEELDELEAPPPPRRDERVTAKSSKSHRRADEEEDDGDDRSAPRRRGGRYDEDDEDDDYGRQRSEPSKGDVRQGWERVRFGINLVIIGNWIGLAAIGVMISGWLVLVLFVGVSLSTIVPSATAGGPMNQHQAGQMAGQAAGTMAGAAVGACAFIAIFGLIFLTSVALRFTGVGFCMGVPSTRKTQMLKGLAITSFSLSIANLVLPMLSSGVTVLTAARNGVNVVGISGESLGALLGAAALVCFLLFLRGAAVAMRKDGLARNLVIYLVGIGVYAFLIIPIAIVLFFAMGAAAMFGSVSSASNGQAAAANAANTMAGLAMLGISCFILLFLIGVGLFVWYMVLLYQTRTAVDGWLARN